MQHQAASRPAGGASGGGGCDAASHTIDLADFDLSCAVASDCAAVFAGNFCQGCTCPFSAINAAGIEKYKEEAQIKSAGAPTGGCFCPASEVLCAQGQCAGQVP